MIYRYFNIIFFLLLIFLNSCKKERISESTEIKINENWLFRKAGDTAWHAAKVPGDVISDLLNNQLINDPYYDENEKDVQWIEKQDWEYRTKFDVPVDVMNGDRLFLHFDGLDTYADVYLNDSLIMKADNMFRSWNVPCDGLMKERDNILTVYFHSAVNEGMKKLKQLPYLLPAINEQAPENERTGVYTRKAFFHYGWDWGPRLVTCGIWRNISIRSWSRANINDIYLSPDSISDQLAKYTALVDIETIKDGEYQVRFTVDDEPVGSPFSTNLKAGHNQEKFSFEITRPNLWWCNGMGSQYLYNLKVQLYKNEELISGMNRSFGIRKLELVQDSDAIGRSFYFRLNGVPVFMKGTNYIPLDILTSRVTKDRYQQVIDAIASANMNMVRVWGGGIYENDEFYELCDQKGILVWQDFMFACAMQPGDSEHIENIRQEAVQNVKRLRNHPCLAFWCGNNENLVGWNNWAWKNNYPKKIAQKIWNDYEKLFYDILPGIVRKYDTQTAYKASSPSSYYNHLPDKRSGDEHEWGVWFDMGPFSKYAERPGRFVSEYGMQSFPSMRTIRTFTQEDSLNPRSVILDFHQRCNMPYINPNMNGNEMISDYIQMYYNDPVDFESFIYLSQINQAEAMKSAIEAHRTNRSHCMGSLYWQINDCWPCISWSTMDYFGRWKPAHYAVRRAFANLVVIPQRIDGNVKLYVVNDSLANIKTELNLKMIDFKGKVFWNIKKPIEVVSNSSQMLFSVKEEQLCPEHIRYKACLVAQLINNEKIISENILYFADPKYLDLPVPDISYNISGSSNKFEITLKTDKLARNVVLETREKDAVFSDNALDMIPGRDITLFVTYMGTRQELMEDLIISTLVNSY
jgi:beta-mannosidase